MADASPAPDAASAPRGHHECRRCGARSTWAAGFRPERRLFRGGTAEVCVTCWLYDLKHRRFYRAWGLALLVVLAFSYDRTGSVPGALLYTASLYVALFLALVVHEAGHALAGHAMGLRPCALSLGGGPNSKVLRWRDRYVLLSPVPVEGLVVLLPRDAERFRLKMAVTLLAGPLVNIVAGLLILYLGAGPSEMPDEAARFVLFFLVANGLGAMNLWPFEARSQFGVQRSDGRQLLELRKLGDAEIAKRVATAAIVHARIAFHHGDRERAYSLLEEAFPRDEWPPQAKWLASAALIDLGRLQEGIELTRRCLAADELADFERAVLENNLAFALLDSPGDHLAEADELSRAAFEVLPMTMGVRGTRGAVLVAKGDYRAAIALLEDRRFALESKRSRAIVKANLAVAYAGIGDGIPAARALAASAALEPGNAAFERAKTRLESSTASEAARARVAD
jgi:tetratricopeptide (TPR) repeat protein